MHSCPREGVLRNVFTRHITDRNTWSCECGSNHEQEGSCYINLCNRITKFILEFFRRSQVNISLLEKIREGMKHRSSRHRIQRFIRGFIYVVVIAVKQL